MAELERWREIHEENAHRRYVEYSRRREERKAEWWARFNAKLLENALERPAEPIEILGDIAIDVVERKVS